MDAAHHDDVEATLTGAVTFGVDAYTCADYARAERDKLWRKVWQQVGRVEDLPKVGSYLTYDILDDSIVVVRSAADTFKAHHNVCMHRGRRLVDIPPGAKNVCGHKKSFVCGFHGWTYDQDGNCIHIPEKPDWQGALTPENTHLAAVNVDTWGGWIWINMDPAAQPLRQYLEPAATMLDPFRLQDMRCKWRKWLTFQCNWKVAMEAFNETYHVATTHPQFNKFGNFRGWGRPPTAATATSATTRRRTWRRPNPRSGSEPELIRGYPPPKCSATRSRRPTRPPPERWWTPRCVWSRSCPTTHPRVRYSITG